MSRDNESKAGKEEYDLACELSTQRKYDEAEELFRKSFQKRRRVLGSTHKDTLCSKYKLAYTLYKHQKYNEAEPLFRELVQREKVLGSTHKDTLKSKYQLGLTLYKQQKFDEAEPLLRELVQQRGKVLGSTHEDTLWTKHQLAYTLSIEQKFDEAELLFRELVQQRGKVLGSTNEDTLRSKHQLVYILLRQQKHNEAEQLARELVQQRGEVLGRRHKDTLASKDLLADTLSIQQKYNEAEQLGLELVQQRGEVLGRRYKDTLASKDLLQRVTLAKVSSATSGPHAEAVLSLLDDFFVEGSKRQTSYNDSEIQRISLLLARINTQWGKVPRTYITLRNISCLDSLDTFIGQGFSDHWFPVTERGLPNCLRSSQRAQFVVAQNLVMTKSLDLEKGAKGRHHHFHHGEPLPFEEKGILGTGAFGQVDRILSLISYREYARKQVLRSTIFGGRRTEHIKQFVDEIEVLKRLKHRHIVEFVGSYTDPQYMGLIMSPIADMDLSTYLAYADAAKHNELRTFFGCLARALEFLHGESIRHKDIKPKNILVHRGKVLFTDFGLAFDFMDEEGSTTFDRPNGGTPRYYAPEVANHEPRNTSSDIWSLGVVFLEMAAVLKGRTAPFIDKFLSEHGSRQAYVRTNPDGLRELLANLTETSHPTDNIVLTWIQDMLMIYPNRRPTAVTLMESIIAARESGYTGLCGICCVSPHEFIDDYDELRK